MDRSDDSVTGRLLPTNVYEDSQLGPEPDLLSHTKKRNDHGHSHHHGHDHPHKHHKQQDHHGHEHHGHDDHGHGHGHGHGNEHSPSRSGSRPWYHNPKLRKMAFIGVLMTLYSVAEIGFSIYLDSLVMLSDGLHNASDGVAVAIAFWAEKKKLSPKMDRMTYGWRRTEIMGGLFNGVFLLSMAIFILLEALPHFVEPEMDDQDSDLEHYMFIGIAGAGIVLNVIGVTLFSEAHGHSHGGDDGGHGHSHGHAHGNEEEEENDHDDDGGEHVAVDHNMWGLFVHFLGDVLTSMLVLGVGLIYLYSDKIQKEPWGHYFVEYADPGASVLSSAIITYTSIGLVKSCSWILLQTVPKGVDINKLTDKICDLKGVQSVHELHVWQLVDGVNIASMHCHVLPSDLSELNQIIESIRKVLHKYRIHSSTIQPEVLDDPATRTGTPVVGCVISGGRPCVDDCEAEACCTEDEHNKINTATTKRRTSVLAGGGGGSGSGSTSINPMGSVN